MLLINGWKLIDRLVKVIFFSLCAVCVCKLGVKRGDLFELSQQNRVKYRSVKSIKGEHLASCLFKGCVLISKRCKISKNGIGFKDTNASLLYDVFI